MFGLSWGKAKKPLDPTLRYEERRVPPAMGRLWLLGALLLVAIPHLLRLPIPLLAGGFGAFYWRYRYERYGNALPGRYLKGLLVVLVLAGVGTNYHTIAGREAGMALLSMMLALKVLELHDMRDALFALFIGYFLVVGNFLFATDIFTGLYTVVVVLALTAGLIALNDPGARRVRARTYLRLGSVMLLQAIPLMVVMFVLFPRLSGPLWSMPQTGKSGVTGLTDNMSIGNINQLADSDQIAFRVQFDGAAPPANQLYWRGPVLWHTDGRNWQPLHRRYLNRPSYEIPDYSAQSKPLAYDVTMEPNGKRWIFALDLPANLPPKIPTLDVMVTRDFQLITLQPVDERVRYHLSSVTAYRTTLTLPKWERENGLQLPDENPRTIALGRQWRQSGLDDPQIVAKALAMYRDEPFWYSRRPPALGDNPLDRFLFDTRRGFCEHYAASFTYLMRAAGIPARVIAGYQGGEANQLGNYLIVRQANAHAWSEVWLQGRGWTRVDPTAVIPSSRVDAEDALRFQTTDGVFAGARVPLVGGLVRQLGYVWDSINYHWNLYFLGFDKNRQEELMRQLGLGQFGWQGMILLLVGIVGTAIGAITLRAYLVHREHTDPVLRVYSRFLRRLGHKGFVKGEAEGARDFARRVVSAHPQWGGPVNTITALYLGLRYGRRPPRVALGELKKAVRAFRP